MKYYIIIGIFLLIIGISLAMDYYFTLNNIDIFEGYQSFSKSQVEEMSRCIPKSYTMVDPSCTYIKYFDISGNIKDGYFSNLPNNFFIDVCNILQPVPFGNKLTADRRGYMPVDKSMQYSTSQKYYQENAINPSICNKTDNDYDSTSPKTCYDASYIQIDVNGKPLILRNRIRIPDKYYVNNGLVNIIPYGYEYVNPNDKTSIKMSTNYAKDVSNTKYNISNFNDVQYHTDPTLGNDMSDNSTAGPGKMWILDKDKKLVAVPYSDEVTKPLYYEPGSFRFGSSNYVPSYQETVYLSKLTNISTLSPVLNTSSMMGGFCYHYKDSPDDLERMCNDLSGNTCASTSCCVLLGGQKCVHGNENGPKYKSNYSNFLVKNPEFYYYQGKCYGNCQ